MRTAGGAGKEADATWLFSPGGCHLWVSDGGVPPGRSGRVSKEGRGNGKRGEEKGREEERNEERTEGGERKEAEMGERER